MRHLRDELRCKVGICDGIFAEEFYHVFKRKENYSYFDVVDQLVPFIKEAIINQYKNIKDFSPCEDEAFLVNRMPYNVDVDITCEGDNNTLFFQVRLDILFDSDGRTTDVVPGSKTRIGIQAN